MTTSAGRPARQGTAPVPPFTRGQLALLGAILVVATALRLHGSGEWSLWVDEAHTFRDVVVPWDRFWDTGVSNYPLGYLLLRGLLEVDLLPRTSEGWLLLPFVFFGILTVSAVGVFGRAVVGRGAALLAAALLAMSPWHIYWSQNARGYSLTLFFGALAAFAAHRALRERSLLLAALSAVCGVLSGLAHPSGFMMLGVLAGVTAYGVWRDGGMLRRYRWQFGIVGVVALGTGIAWLAPAVWTAFEKKPGFSLLHFVQTLAWFVGVPVLAAALAGVVTMVRGRRLDSLSLVAAWVVLPVGALLICSLAMRVTAQYALVALPGICLLAGRFAVDVAESIGGRTWTCRVAGYGLPLVLLLFLAGHDFLYFTQRHGDRPRWREACRIVQQDAGASGRLVLTTNTPSVDYYLDRGAFHGVPDANTAVVGITPWDLEAAGDGAAWLATMVAHARVEERALHVVITAPELAEFDRDGSFDAAVRRNGHQIGRLPCWTGPKDMTVLVYRVPVATGDAAASHWRAAAGVLAREAGDGALRVAASDAAALRKHLLAEPGSAQHDPERAARTVLPITPAQLELAGGATAWLEQLRGTATADAAVYVALAADDVAGWESAPELGAALTTAAHPVARFGGIGATSALHIYRLDAQPR